MSDFAPRKSGSCLGKLLFFFLFLSACGLAVCLYVAAQPQDLGDVEGHFRDPELRDLSAVLKNATSRNIKVTIREKELNQWLRREMEARQTGPFAEQVKFERVWVRLCEGVAEVVMERKVAGHPFTVSMFLRVKQTEGQDGLKSEVLLHGGPYHESMQRPYKGGRFGKLPVPQGFLLLVLPAYEKLAAAFQEEIRLGFHEMSRIAIKDGYLELDPNSPDMRLE